MSNRAILAIFSRWLIGQHSDCLGKECRLKQGNMYMLEDIALELVDDLNFHISF